MASFNARRRLLLATASFPVLLIGGTASAQTAGGNGEPTASSNSSSAEPATDATNEGAGQTTPTQIDSTAQAPADPSATGDQSIVVTGYRASLQSQANAKRRSIGFTDSIFAEDIGKFPDTNIAESVNRIPGVTISREVTGEGSNIAIRGLGTNFTRVLLNGAPVAVASVRFDAQSTNREVDLDLLPTELFTQLTVSKSPTASQLEGGAAGTVNLRSARPFDNPKPYISYGLQGTKNSNADKWGYNGHLLASRTFGDFGILVGGAFARNEFRVDGYETIGFTNPNLSASQRTGATRNPTGSGNFTIPATVPANAGNGLTVGAPIDQAFLLSRNPGATIDQIDNGILPRLSRPRDEVGYRFRKNAIASLEYRPSDALQFYVDGMYGTRKTDFTRSALNWAVRNSAPIPLNTQYDRSDCTAGCVVTSGTYANAQFFLEYRPYMDDQKFWGINPGAQFTISSFIKGDIQANLTKSDFHRESPTVLVITPPSSGITVDYVNNGGVPQVNSNIDLNDPKNFGWYGGARVNLNGEDRKTKTKGIRGSLLFGDETKISARIGAAYDDVQRRITPFDATNAWSNAICGNGPNITLEGPNTAALPCTGLSVPGTQVPGTPIAPGFPDYAGYGTNYTAGGPPIVYAGSLIPNSAIASYLRPNDTGFITVDWDRFAQDTNYEGFLQNRTEVRSGSSGANGGLVREKVLGTFFEINGIFDVGDDDQFRFNAGARHVRTDQIIGGVISIPDIRNTVPTPIADGGRYPNQIVFLTDKSRYKNWLPSFTAAYNFGRKAVARGSISKTMTRPDPNALLPGATFNAPSADVGSIGNQELDPYISTNIDLGFEYYTGGEGVIAFAAFRKSITGFTVNGTTRQPLSFLTPYGITFEGLTSQQREAICTRLGSPAGTTNCSGGNNAEILLTQQVNSDGKLKVNGLEFQITQPLDIITERWGFTGLGVQGNLTLIDQKGEGAGAPAVAIGVSPKTYNLTGYYDNNGISARLSYTFNEGSQGSNPGQNGFVAPLGVIWGRDYKQLDFSGNVDLSKVLGNAYLPTVVLNVINITKESQGSYFDYPNATFNEYNPGRTVMLGVRGRF
ncbi:TonB-dependent receptor [Sphingomonas piscis]|uniref:TonB-dependent receptor n=1 Tax=Sphingomonas piscis TaxID=2714943 RepID=A0A6G7YMS6_9SPHN|nr:TonB-dependent receptor [Sphingomonas piscis]QIK78042.1 TonB-dependent receptor [Sphingomonas piscis]